MVKKIDVAAAILTLNLIVVDLDLQLGIYSVNEDSATNRMLVSDTEWDFVGSLMSCFVRLSRLLQV
jgi:hypothetical protein